jgi:hypothetical protein
LTMKIELRCPDCGRMHVYDIGVIIETCEVINENGERVEKQAIELVNAELIK